MNTNTIHPAAGYAGDIYPELAWQWLQQGQAYIVDVRTAAEWAWVGTAPGSITIEWKSWPDMAANPQFTQQLQAAVPIGAKVAFLCRSGVRSQAAANKAQSLGYEAFNILEGFEGDLDAQRHRGQMGGWRKRGLPWTQG